MRVGVYVDGFNLYYGGLSQLGSTPGWKWIDLRALASRFAGWSGSHIDRVVYCTARVNDPADPLQTQRQDFYLKALQLHGSVDLIEEGYYSSWAKESVLTNEAAGAKAPTSFSDPTSAEFWTSGLRLRRNGAGTVFATVRKREEKGSDVNVATHLLADVLQGSVDAAIVISNDSDLALPIRMVRSHVPTGVLNPNARPLSNALKGSPNDGVGSHWWRRISAHDFRSSQLPSTVGSISKPSSW
ncbi:NYN domain-containing protein [Curtobacterium sp. NPDC090217]|uniref:NYN domain-containing protein n=1 Tax=Curtobacterium sp. NPDC090217 TaxID=3363970 RepID=UPI003811FABF